MGGGEVCVYVWVCVWGGGVCVRACACARTPVHACIACVYGVCEQVL